MNQPDDLLIALRAARPDTANQPSPSSAEATALLNRVLARPPATDRTRLTRRLVLAGIPALAVAAAAGGIAAATHDESGSATALPEPSFLRTAILDAFEQSSGGIFAMVGQSQSSNGPASSERMWVYPMFPHPGQQVRVRVQEARRGTVEQDVESAYIQPSPSAGAPASGATLTVNYATRTWFRQQTPAFEVSFTEGPSAIRGGLASGTFRITGTGRIHGRPAIKVTTTKSGGGTTTTQTLWVDAKTYAMLQGTGTTTSLRPNGTMFHTRTEQFEVLPATTANLALLTSPIPAGFTRRKSSSQGES